MLLASDDGSDVQCPQSHYLLTVINDEKNLLGCDAHEITQCFVPNAFHRPMWEIYADPTIPHVLF
jgi:hypothetical protein